MAPSMCLRVLLQAPPKAMVIFSGAIYSALPCLNALRGAYATGNGCHLKLMASLAWQSEDCRVTIHYCADDRWNGTVTGLELENN